MIKELRTELKLFFPKNAYIGIIQKIGFTAVFFLRSPNVNRQL